MATKILKLSIFTSFLGLISAFVYGVVFWKAVGFFPGFLFATFGIIFFAGNMVVMIYVHDQMMSDKGVIVRSESVGGVIGSTNR